MSLFDSIFGTTSQNIGAGSLFGNATSNIANQAYNQFGQHSLAQQGLSQAYTQQQMAQYQQARNKPKWMYNGIECTAKEFAKLMWPDGQEEQMMFILKHGEE